MWYANGPHDPWGTHKQIEQALHHDQPMPMFHVLIDPNVLIDLGDYTTASLFVRSVQKKRADVVQFLISRGADLNHERVSLLHAAVWSGRYSDAVFVLDMGAAVDARLARVHGRSCGPPTERNSLDSQESSPMFPSVLP